MITLAIAANLTVAGTAGAIDFAPAYTPKPDILPGPSVEEQQERGTRQILITGTLPKYIVGLIAFVGGVSLLFLIIAGVRFAASYGNDESVTKAKDQAIYALVGFVIALLSYTIVTIIVNFDFTKS